MKKLRQEFADTMLEVGEKDENLVVLVGDISHGILKPFAQKFPNRYYNIGICEQTIVNMAAGLSKVGLIPIVHTIAPFIIERAYEQIKLDFGYQKLPLNLISVGSAFDYAQLGCSHHCYSDVSLMSHFKNSYIFCPGSAEEFNILFNQVYNNGKINYFRLTEYPHQVKINNSIKVGEVIHINHGNELTIVTTGAQLKNTNKVSQKLKKEGINVDLLYLPTLKPFPHKSVIKSLEKTKKILTVEELSSHDGLYNQCIKYSMDVGKFKSKQIAIDDFVHSYGTYEDICAFSGLNFENIYESAKILINGK